MKTILIVDDEYDILNSLEMVFEAEGYIPRTAHDGQEALDRLTEEPIPDLILSDVMMPVIDGYGLVTAIRALPTFCHIPIILMSGASLDMTKIQKSDYAYFMHKPFDLNLLISKVEKALHE
jgi:CheY-like chemotaxis protein